MEMKGLIIGIGAAGNKSVINLIEKDVVSSDDVMLINSTSRFISFTFWVSSIKPDGLIM